VDQAVFKLYLQDGREYFWQCSNKEERDVWAVSVSASIRSLGSMVQVLLTTYLDSCCFRIWLRSVKSQEKGPKSGRSHGIRVVGGNLIVAAQQNVGSQTGVVNCA